jgi:DinB superfamily
MGILSATTAGIGSPSLNTLETNPVAIQQQLRVADQIRQTTWDAEAFLLGRDEADLLIRLKPESWCVAECLDHLTQTTRAFLPAISEAIAKAPKLTADRRLRTGIFPSLFIRSLNPPYWIRFKVLPQLAPQSLSPGQAWSDFVESQSELLATVSSAAGLAIDRVTIKSPVYARISYNIYGVFRMLAAHQNRHIWQIAQILKTLDRQRKPASLR